MRKYVVGLVLLAAGAIAGGSASARSVFSGEPPEGSVRFGQRVFVDDGSCPAGQVKMIVGGNNQKGIARRRSCVRR